ncbi:glycosyltransferase family 4 protein [Candidatus Formimonas warabiya]|uniref:Glycosyltransferase family 4 protein n=1 Tax=Formimonas warabiya TaxID=1761012 RepID=A0A3G1KQV6_FORW1|nr:glycosyltransferase family 4 protein [Candidatus Formimonas warabiya]ATW24495.1 hypothetical protein DCMF_06620 [Candidatus Formimonas warabiya]
MRKDLNIFFYTNDNNPQSKRQIYPLVVTIQNAGFHTFFNIDLTVAAKNVVTKDTTYVSLEEYSIVNSKSKTIIFTFTIMDVIKANKIIKNNVNYRIIFRPRGIIPEESFYRNGSYIRKKILDIIEKKAMKIADFYCFITEYQKIHFISKYFFIPNIFTRALVVHNYLSTDLLNNTWPVTDNKVERDKVRFVYSGGFSKWQNIEEIFKLIKSIYDNYQNIEFNIYTFEGNNEKATKLITKYNLLNITKISNLQSHEINYHLSFNDVGIIIRDNSLINITSSPLKIIDYLNAKIGLILTDNIGDFSNILKNKPYVFLIKLDIDGNILYNVNDLIKFLCNIKNTKIKEIIDSDTRELFSMEKQVLKLKEYLQKIDI